MGGGWGCFHHLAPAVPKGPLGGKMAFSCLNFCVILHFLPVIFPSEPFLLITRLLQALFTGENVGVQRGNFFFLLRREDGWQGPGRFHRVFSRLFSLYK